MQKAIVNFTHDFKLENGHCQEAETLLNNKRNLWM